MLVENMLSSSNNPVTNQFIIYHDNAIYFQSYKTVIAAVNNGVVTVSAAYDYSVTTSKYLHKFIDEYAIYNMDADTRKNYKNLRDNCNLSYSKLIEKAIKENIFKYSERI